MDKIIWPDISFPPINLWSAPNLERRRNPKEIDMLVVFDTKTNQYRVFNGRELVMKVESTRSLTPDELEEFRKDPHKYLES